MSYATQYLAQPPLHPEVEQLPGATMLEFGTPWCGHCRRAQPLIAQALEGRTDIAHLKVEDGPGRSLGRSYGVKLWPTLVFLRDGHEMARLVRPQDIQALHKALACLTSTPQPPPSTPMGHGS